MFELNGFGWQLLQGFGVTIAVSVTALIFGLFLALFFTLMQFTGHTLFKTLVAGFTGMIRGVPELLVLFGLYFGGSAVFSFFWHRPVEVSAFWAGVLALGTLFSAYASQTLRGAFLAIPKGQTEAAKALGLTAWVIFKRILLPQAWRHAFSGLSNLWLCLLKDSALVALIGLGELMNKAQLAASTTNQPFKFYMLAALGFLILTSLSQLGFNQYRQRLRGTV